MLGSQDFWRRGSCRTTYMEPITVCFSRWFFFVLKQVHLLRLFRRMLHHCFTVSLRKCLVDFETSPDLWFSQYWKVIVQVVTRLYQRIPNNKRLTACHVDYPEHCFPSRINQVWAGVDYQAEMHLKQIRAELFNFWVANLSVNNIQLQTFFKSLAGEELLVNLTPNFTPSQHL